MSLKKILIAGDDEDTVFLTNLILDRHGYQTECLEQGALVLSYPLTGIDLIIVDNEMKTADGISICKSLKKRDESREVPVVILAADYNCYDRATKAGVEKIVYKPVDPVTLVDVVNNVLTN
jgi:DNA-binding response OmpR family regulator